MDEMVKQCRAKGYRQIMAVAGVQSSVEFHKRHGFVVCGCWWNVGLRWGRLVNVWNLQLFLQPDMHAQRQAQAAASGCNAPFCDSSVKSTSWVAVAGALALGAVAGFAFAAHRRR